MDARFQQQLAFIIEIDKLKQVLRQTLLCDSSRRENDAEHSWHIALMAPLLAEYAPEGTDICKVTKMALVHDLVEIYAGDTFAYDQEGHQDKAAREAEAADRLFALLPEDQGAELRALWDEFDAMETREAQFGAALDRLQPFIHNAMTNGHTWKLGQVDSEQVYKRMDMVRVGTPGLWPFVQQTVEYGIKKGLLPK